MFKRRSRPRPQLVRTDAEWQTSLGPEAYRVLRRSGTESPGSSQYAHLPADADGVYRCAVSDSATRDAVLVRTDFKLLFPRREARCARCGGHLGHVFADGPVPTGQRWCINGAALTLDEGLPEPTDPHV
jgi:peptide-methionine (R)-S-oxide reductase